MLYADDLKKKKATLAELVKAEAEWRETAERQIENLVGEAYFPESIDEVEDAVMEIVQLAQNVEADAIEWGKVAVACAKRQAKAKKA
jgi:hypothetical protein